MFVADDAAWESLDVGGVLEMDSPESEISLLSEEIFVLMVDFLCKESIDVL